MTEIYKDPSYTPAERARDLLSRMTLEEKVGQMIQANGRDKDNPPEKLLKEMHIGSCLHMMGDSCFELQEKALETRLGIPILFGIDAIHGHAFWHGAVVFPTPLAMSSSWNPELLEEVARITAKEVILTGVHWTFSPVLDLARDPRWGRVDEGFGEDPFLTGILAEAMVKGYQGEDLSAPYSILACAKHFVAYGETVGGRDSTECDISERKLRSVFLPPFKRVVDAGCATIMAAYHANDGVPCSADKRLLTEILKEEWGFEGFVVTDWDNVGHMLYTQKLVKDIKEASRLALEAGNDMIMVTLDFYDKAIELVREGIISEELIDEACRRILELKFRLGLFDEKRFPDRSKASEIIGCEEHRQVAYQAALESIVLLKNENNILPLKGDVEKIAVIGPNADDITAQYGDWALSGRGENGIPTVESTGYDKSLAITVLDGIRERAGDIIKVFYEKGCDIYNPDDEDIASAVKIAEEADVVIAVVGDTTFLYGECCDRADLSLTGAQEELLKALKETGKPLIVVLINGKPLTIPWIKENADAILEAWNPGMEGGKAVASILFGDYNPSGKLTISFPVHVGQIPVYYNQLPGWHGGKYIDVDKEPLFPFGYGLSYTEYKYSNLRLEKSSLSKDDTLKITVDVENVGKMAGTEIVQAYVCDLYSSVTTPIKELKGFARVFLEAGEKKEVAIEIPVSSLALVNRDLETVVEAGEFELMVGSSSRDQDLLRTSFWII